MFRAIGDTNPADLLGNVSDRRASLRRSGQPVRRRSGCAGRCEGLFYRRITAREAGQIRLAARKYELVTKQAGARNGALGGIALEVLDYLTRLIGRDGRLEPSLDFLMRKLRRSRDAIHRALKALRQHGFLDWLRRYVPTGNEGRGVQVQQTSNAYRLSLPERARRLLGRMMGDSPLPDDFAHARAAQEAEAAAQIATLPMRGQMALKFEDSGMAASMAAIWEGIQRKKERESASRTESMLDSISKGN